MSDELLPYYNRELAFLRKTAADFAAAHPKIAQRLNLSDSGETQDPHVSRLVEAFAYLTARTRHKLDDEFPEITDALLGLLYPHYLAPIPSMAVVECQFDRSQGEPAAGYPLPRGTAIESETIDGEPCRFRTAYPVTLWPIEVTGASILARPYAAPAAPRSGEAISVLKLELACTSKELTFAQLAADSLRFYLHGQPQHAYELYQLLFRDVINVAVASSPSDARPTVLGRQALLPVGFEREEGMLPYSARSFLGYRLLTEFFAFPEKFLFFDLAGLKPGFAGRGRTVEVYFYLERSSADLEQNVRAGTFRLGCTPIVNLFSQRAEPIRLTQRMPEYRVVPDARRPLANEIHSIDSVTASSSSGAAVEFRPFYSFQHAADASAQKTFWHATRRGSARRGDEGTEVHLALVDLDFKLAAPADWTLDVETTCTNRDLPHRLPFGGNQPRLHLSQGGPISRIVCLTRPTRTLRPPLRRGAWWRLISHLSLNHLSLEDGPQGALALREILRLYDFVDSAEIKARLDSVSDVRMRRVVGRSTSGPQGGICQGVEIRLALDRSRLSDHSDYLFAAVLERFFALYASLNSFTKLLVVDASREGQTVAWPPRAGEKALL